MNGDTLCNLKSNLRFANAVENARNKQGLPTNNTSGFLGVYWNKSANKWVAEIHVKGRKVHLGYFVDKMDAVRARDLAVKEHYGEFATTNKSLGLY